MVSMDIFVIFFQLCFVADKKTTPYLPVEPESNRIDEK